MHLSHAGPIRGSPIVSYHQKGRRSALGTFVFNKNDDVMRYVHWIYKLFYRLWPLSPIIHHLLPLTESISTWRRCRPALDGWLCLPSTTIQLLISRVHQFNTFSTIKRPPSTFRHSGGPEAYSRDWFSCIPSHSLFSDTDNHHIIRYANDHDVLEILNTQNSQKEPKFLLH